MMASMFSLDHRLAELRKVGDDLRAERQVRDAGRVAGRPGRSIGETIRNLLDGLQAEVGSSNRLAAH